MSNLNPKQTKYGIFNQNPTEIARLLHRPSAPFSLKNPTFFKKYSISSQYSKYNIKFNSYFIRNSVDDIFSSQISKFELVPDHLKNNISDLYQNEENDSILLPVVSNEEIKNVQNCKNYSSE